MSYFGPWFEDSFLDSWFDSAANTPASGNGGVSKARILGTQAPRPQVPPWRQVEGPAGLMLTQVRNYLNEVGSRDIAWGNYVDVEFPAAGVTIAVDTGLGGPAKGYQVVRTNAAETVFDGTSADPDPKRGTLYLQATGACKVTLYIH